MPFTRTTFLRILKIGSAVIFILIVVVYALSRSLNYARGPHIVIIEPTDGTTILTEVTDIRGRVERANNVILNGKTVNIDEQGNFNETLVIFTGLNIITIEAKDQFGRSTTEQIRVVRK